MIEWELIDTAPKDGRAIVAASESKTHSGWETKRFPYPMKLRWIDGKWVDNDGYTYDPQPTHWQPE